MSTSKFPAISAELLRRINNGTYRDRIPPTRELAAEFGVARQTVTNALRPLIAGGAVVAAPFQGLKAAKPPAAAVKRRVALACRTRMSEQQLSSFFETVKEYIADRGFALEVLNFPDGIPALNPERDFQQKFAGVIFKDSLLTLELAEYLAGRNIPIVSCNLMPMVPWLNYVEVDVFYVLRKLAAHLADLNYRKVSWFFASQLESYGTFARRSWKNIRNDSLLEHFPGDTKVVPRRPAKSSAEFKNYLLKLHRSRIKPEVIVCSWDMPDDYLQKVEAEHPDLLPGVIFVTFQENKPLNVQHTVCRIARFHGGTRQILSAFDALQEKMLVNNRQPIRRMIEYDFELLDKIPEKNPTKKKGKQL